MDQARFEYLYEQYLKRSLSRDEDQEWKAALADPNLYAELNNLVKGLWNRNDLPAPELDKARAEAIYQEIISGASTEGIGAAVVMGEGEKTALPVRKLRFGMLPRVAMAAAAVAAIVFGVWLFSAPRHSGEGWKLGSAKYANDIAPGRNTATLTLANGEVITLDTNRNSVVIADSVKTFTMLTASTPRGGTYRVTLPDGTNVWLNAASTLTFPSEFTGKERIVELTGEAYFEVATSYSARELSTSEQELSSSERKKLSSSGRALSTSGRALSTSEMAASYSSLRGRRTRQSFLVRTAGQEISVLGTHFNVNAYEEEGNVKTTLLEGSVRVTSTGKSPDSKKQGSVLLKPNQQSVLTAGAINVFPADVEETVAWKNGYFRFNNEPIQSIMLKLSRWYTIEVSYGNEAPTTGFYGTISRSKNISEVLEMLEQTKGVHFKIEGRRVTVTK